MTGREEELDNLNSLYNADKNILTVLYGKYRVGKTTLLREFMKNKSCLYFEASQTVDVELLHSLNAAMAAQMENYAPAKDYDALFDRIKNSGIRLIVLEEFQNLVKADLGFIVSLLRFYQDGEREHNVMIVLTGSSVAWVENSMVKSMGRAALYINSFIKIKEFNYSDTVDMFPECSAGELLGIYAVTGGMPGYLTRWNPKQDIKSNICRLFLSEDSPFMREAELYLKDEFRETGVYSIILKCLAAGMNKLNEIHEYTGYGRDKISVYLKNMIEREIVEKVFSFEGENSELTRKGLYRIKDDFISFWYRFVYPEYGILAVTPGEVFYDRYIAPGFNDFLLEAFIKIASEFMNIINNMGRLPFKGTYKGRWHGKMGELHIIFEGDKGQFVIGQAFVGDVPVGTGEYNTILADAKLAGLENPCVYMFSACGFTEELLNMQGPNLVAVRIEDL
ncbi:MAG: ATP-binding protein [Butyrivibrio sp.]